MTELPKLTTDVFNHPECPGWAQWAAVDECGDAYVYETKPIKQSEDWHTDEGGDFVGEYDPSDWQNSLIERTEDAKKEGEKDMTKFPKLTVDVFNHPDCPEWAKWAAVNEDGKGYLYSSEPIRGLHVWHFGIDNDYFGDYDPSDWQNSLIERPAADLPEHDDVKAPSYYVNTPFGLEVRKITEHYDPYIAAALQYIFRNGQKVYDGLTAKESAIKDLRKAIQNIKFEIEKIENS